MGEIGQGDHPRKAFQEEESELEPQFARQDVRAHTSCDNFTSPQATLPGRSVCVCVHYMCVVQCVCTHERVGALPTEVAGPGSAEHFLQAKAVLRWRFTMAMAFVT